MPNDGDRVVAERIEQHLPLVKQIVFQVSVHFPRHVDREELARAGALGLVEAAHRYDDTRGVPFARFAALRIRGAILDAVRSTDWAPRSVRRLARRLEDAEQQLVADLGRAPTVTETAATLGVSREELAKLRDQLVRSCVLTIDHVVGEDLSLVDVLPDLATAEPSEQLDGRELRAYLRDAVRLLPERHRLVVVGYFLEGRTSRELARFLGVTVSRITQLRGEALAMLHDGIEAQYVGSDAAIDEPVDRAARRRATYAASIATASDSRSRLDRIPVGVRYA